MRDTLYFVSAVLIVSADRNAGQSLAEWARAAVPQVFCASHKAEAVVLAHDEGCTLALLDDSLGVQALREIAEALRLVMPEIALAFLQGEEALPPMLSLRPYAILQKPISPEKLSAFLQGEIEPVRPASPVKQTGEEGKSWLEDANRAARHLTQLTLESAAQAAMLLQQGHVWAYAGQLTQEAITELERLVEHIARQKGGDILRFIHLNSTRAEHLIYITEMEEGMLLALVFDAETPFSVLRAQANRLTTMLRQGPVTGTPAPPAAPEPPAQPPAHSQAQPPSPAEPPSQPELSIEESPETSLPALPSIADILGTVPSPEPEGRAEILPAPIEVEEELPAEPVVPQHPVSIESSPAIPLRKTSPPAVEVEELAETRRHEPEELAETRKSTKKMAEELVQKMDALGETRPHTPEEARAHGLPEPISPARAELTFACLLIPRFASHHLTGDLASRLAEWVPSICIAYGWRLEHLSIRPEYLQWVVSVPPSTSPGMLMRLMRMQTSERIFAEFPRLKQENPSGDFWAPGYLIMGSNQPHPPQLVRNYILETRRHQGISHPRL